MIDNYGLTLVSGESPSNDSDFSDTDRQLTELFESLSSIIIMSLIIVSIPPAFLVGFFLIDEEMIDLDESPSREKLEKTT